jgi:hypothetical protein
MPMPWDPVFLDHWSHFLQRLGRLATAYPGVQRIEIGIPADAHDPESVQRWQRASYTAEKVLDAYRFTIAHWATAFPDADLAVPVSPHSFPDVDGSAQRTLNTLIGDSAHAFRDRFLLQIDNRDATGAWRGSVREPARGQIAWRLEEVRDAAELRQGLAVAIVHHALSVEVSCQDLANPDPDVQALLAQAHARLLQEPLSPVLGGEGLPG